MEHLQLRIYVGLFYLVLFVLFFFYSDFLCVCILLECCTYCIYWTLWSVTSSYYKWEIMFYCFTVPTWNKVFLLLLLLLLFLLIIRLYRCQGRPMTAATGLMGSLQHNFHLLKLIVTLMRLPTMYNCTLINWLWELAHSRKYPMSSYFVLNYIQMIITLPNALRFGDTFIHWWTGPAFI